MECKIAAIQPGRVRLMGTIVSREPAEGKLRLDDGSGQVEVFFDQLELLEAIGKYKEGDRVFVAGWATEAGVSGDAISSAAELDLSLYERVNKLWHPIAQASATPGSNLNIDDNLGQGD